MKPIEIQDEARLKLYRKRYEYTQPWKGGPKCRVKRVTETDSTVTVRSVTTRTGEYAGEEARSNTLDKYLCVGGPLSGTLVTSIEIPADYQMFNNANYRGRHRGTADHRAVWIHKSMLKLEKR